MEGEKREGQYVSSQAPKQFGVHSIMYAAFFLIPLLVIPFSAAPFQYSKTLLALFLVVVAVLWALYLNYKKGEVNVRWSLLILSLWALPLVYLVSAIFSQASSLSFFGYQLETNTFGFMLLGATLATVAANTLSESKLIGVLKSVGIGAILVLVFQLVQVLLGAPLPFTVFNDPVVNLVGRWSDFGIYAGLVASFSLLTYGIFTQKLWHKILCAAVFFASMFFLALVNVMEVWILFAVVSAALFVLFVLQHIRGGARSNFGVVVLSGLGVVAALVFLFVGNLATEMQDTFTINSLDVRPSIEGTIDVLKEVYAESPVLGTGPNTFAANWFLYRPSTVLNTPFWNTTFNTGSGTIPTAFITGGVVTLGVWVIFTLLILITIVRALFTTPSSGKAYTATVFSSLGVVYLLVAHYVLAPTQALTLLMFMFIGFFLASINGTSLIKKHTLLLATPSWRQAYSIVAVVLVLVSGFVLYDVARTYASSVYHERGVLAANQGDLEEGGQFVDVAISLKEQDRYLRTRSAISLATMDKIIADNQDEVTDEIRISFQTELVRAVNATGRAVEINSISYENWIARALVYAGVVPLNIDGAFENAQSTLNEARKLNPKSPEVDFRLARLHLVMGDTDEARALLEVSISKKPNYTDAILLLAQLEYNTGNLKEAIESVRALVFFDPTSPVLLYQLGLLLLQDKNYTEAAVAFEAALGEQNDYANAAFFLAQSYAFLDKFSEASQLMNQLAVRNPSNEAVAGYAADLANGINPFDSGEIISPEEEEEVQ